MNLRGAFLAMALLMVDTSAANASALVGPGRFCGYAPIIDLIGGERIVLLQGGIHGGTFEWHGSFGVLKVHGIGWAAKPQGHMKIKPTRHGHMLFAQRKVDGEYVVAIWNRANGSAYFSSPTKITKAQLAAIDRVDLFDETQRAPKNCMLRTVFSWD